MTDFLMVHEAGQGAWVWNRVWGYLTAPVEHPPRLYTQGSANRFFPMDLPGHGTDADGDTGEVRFEECIESITHNVKRRGLQDVVLVGHGLAGMLVIQAASRLDVPPKRLALIAGMVPENQKSPLSMYSLEVRKHLSFLLKLSKFTGRDMKLSRSVVSRYLCNGMETMDITRSLGLFGPLPTQVMETKLAIDKLEIPCPVTYVILNQDRMLSPDWQRRTARLIPGVRIIYLDSCHQAPLHRPRELTDILQGMV